ncbi:MAG: prepilin peptidase [Methylococcaceae bacterium]|nr:prepilin peptidase [Methylococcaceae bacterium]
MTLLTLLEHSPYLLIALAIVLGLMVGSFLNVVIYRLPVMMQREWRNDCLTYLGENTDDNEDKALLEAVTQAQKKAAAEYKPFNLTLPLSRCPKCQAAIKPYQNIPVISYVLLGGKCAVCKNPIAMRYPVIEAFTGLCSAIVAWHIGFDATLPWALLLTWCLIALSFIDIDHQLLPDSMTLPMMWLGLGLSEYGLFTSTDSSIIGAMAGYLSLWGIYWVFKLITGKEGMGYGDFKLLALLGAWLGWQYLPVIVLLSSLVGAVIGVAMILFANKDRTIAIPFGPYLAAAGWIALLWGDELNGLYLASVGL